MAFVVKEAWAIISFISHLFQRKPNESNFDSQTFKHINALKNSVLQSLKMVQSLVTC